MDSITTYSLCVTTRTDEKRCKIMNTEQFTSDERSIKLIILTWSMKQEKNIYALCLKHQEWYALLKSTVGLTVVTARPHENLIFNYTWVTEVTGVHILILQEPPATYWHMWIFSCRYTWVTRATYQPSPWKLKLRLL